jgi:F-type H+-transporting ATPase subunit b
MSRRSCGRALWLVAVLLAAVTSLAAAEGEASPGEWLFKWLNFLLLFGALAYLLRKPFRRYVAGQRRAIQGAIEESRKLEARARQQLAEIDERLARLDEEVVVLRRQAAAEAEAEQRRIRETSEREAERIRATARAEIDSALRAGRLELKAYAARLAVTLAEQKIRGQLTPEAHAALFRVFVENLNRH